MRREDLIAFSTSFSLFAIMIIAISTFSNTMLTPPSSVEKIRFSVNISKYVHHEKAVSKPKKRAVKKKEKVSKKVEKKKIIAKKVPLKVEKAPKIVKKIEKEIIKKEKPTPKEEVAKVEEKVSQTAPEQKQTEQIFTQKQKQSQLNFFRCVKEKINNNKKYPRVAKRRNIEGDTKINFTIFPDGSIKIHNIEGKKVFFNKSREALLDSFPMRIPQDLLMTFPVKINISLSYRLA
jgi:periplasmic protein TonB